VTGIAAEMPDPAAGELDRVAAREAHSNDDSFELKVELGATYDSLAEHGRALASLLLAIHGWLDEQEAASVEVTLDGRRFTLRAPEH
jgi:hypothetical protein